MKLSGLWVGELGIDGLGVNGLIEAEEGLATVGFRGTLDDLNELRGEGLGFQKF